MYLNMPANIIKMADVPPTYLRNKTFFEAGGAGVYLLRVNY